MFVSGGLLIMSDILYSLQPLTAGALTRYHHLRVSYLRPVNIMGDEMSSMRALYELEAARPLSVFFHTSPGLSFSRRPTVEPRPRRWMDTSTVMSVSFTNEIEMPMLRC